MKKILFTKEAWDKIHLYIEHCPNEISGLGAAKFDGDNIIINDIGIWKQECGPAETEVIDHESVVTLAAEMIAKGHSMEELCVWWHSHANIDSFFSATDHNCIEKWINNKFLVAVVGNKKGKYKGMVAIKQPIPCHIDDIEVGLATEEIDISQAEVIKAEIKEKISAPVVKPMVLTSYRQNFVPDDYEPYDYSHGYSKKKKKKQSNKAGDHVQMLNYANWCMCDDCMAIINEESKHFNYSSHYFDNTNKIWTPNKLEHRQIAESRRYNTYDPSLSNYGM